MVRRPRSHRLHLNLDVRGSPPVINLSCVMRSLVRPHDAPPGRQLILRPAWIHVEVAYQKGCSGGLLLKPFSKLTILRGDRASVLHMSHCDR